ncbi:MAG: hypothetical protein LAT82_01355 [Nanoarchaeota archaeon]|nr:hypothetical protein [Nanoarchaeota archaeon]
MVKKTIMGALIATNLVISAPTYASLHIDRSLFSLEVLLGNNFSLCYSNYTSLLKDSRNFAISNDLVRIEEGLENSPLFSHYNSGFTIYNINSNEGFGVLLRRTGEITYFQLYKEEAIATNDSTYPSPFNPLVCYNFKIFIR